ncbi:twin transmembrane helix small protein [Tistlia consotensis]|nr:twin transmembrane helix small protein [Tistlia consotensis]
MSFMIVLVAIAMLVTLGILFTGLFSMARGGEFNRKYGNKLMRARVIAQAVALVLFAIAMLTAGR